jgi:hypothetical protein
MRGATVVLLCRARSESAKGAVHCIAAHPFLRLSPDLAFKTGVKAAPAPLDASYRRSMVGDVTCVAGGFENDQADGSTVRFAAHADRNRLLDRPLGHQRLHPGTRQSILAANGWDRAADAAGAILEPVRPRIRGDRCLQIPRQRRRIPQRAPELPGAPRRQIRGDAETREVPARFCLHRVL